jgi:hypothetical protein
MRFTAGKEEQFWYYGELVKVFKQGRREDALVTEFARVVKELKDLDQADSGSFAGFRNSG